MIEDGGLSHPPVVSLQLGGGGLSACDSLGHNFIETGVVFQLPLVPGSHVVNRLSAEKPPPVVVHVVQTCTNHKAARIKVS